MSAALLWPNLAAEEGEASWRSELRRPGVQALGRDWCELLGAPIEGSLPEPPDPVQTRDSPGLECLRGARGLIPWLSTPEARSEATRQELELWAPDPAVVRRVHDKAFAHQSSLEDDGLSSSIRDWCRVYDPAELLQREMGERLSDAIDAWPAWTQGRFVLKPRQGTSGRGRVAGERRADPRVAGAFARLARRGGCVLQPWLERSQDLSTLIWVPRGEGRPWVVGTAQLRVRPSGVYLGHAGVFGEGGAIHSGSEWDARARTAALRLARRAQSAGFWGPCGVDALVFRGPIGEPELWPCVELNARFTGGWVAAGAARRAFEAAGAPPGTPWSYAPGRGISPGAAGPAPASRGAGAQRN